jgi:hypothetical protein
VREVQLSRNLILEGVILLLNPTIFEVSKVSLDSINRLVNTKKHTYDFGGELIALQESVFSVLFFSFL